MSWTKRQFVVAAFEELGLAAYVFDLQPEQLESALRSMDAMMATWNGYNIKINYPIPTSPENSSLDDETQVPDSANQAIYLNLAIRLAPRFGKVVSVDTKKDARAAYMVLLGVAVKPNEMQLGTLPNGQGNKPWRTDEYLEVSDIPVIVNPINEVGFNNE